MKPFDFDAEYGAGYDTLIRQVVPGYDDLHVAVLAELTPVRDDAEVLVVGIGAGSELVTLGRARGGWHLTGVEPSAQMIAITRERLRRAGIDGRVRIHAGYTDGLPDERRYDAATLVCVMHFLLDDGGKLALLRSIASRLRPGARLILVDGCGAPGTPEFEADWNGWMQFIRGKGMTGAELEAYRRQVEAGVHFVPAARIVELLHESGFGNIRQFYRAFVFGGWTATLDQR